MRIRDWALILGGGSCVWDDVRELELSIYGKQWDGLVIAANDIGSWWPRSLDHWVSLHPNKFERWFIQRRLNGFESAGVYWGRAGRAEHQTSVTWNEVTHWPGSDSGMLAVQVAQLLGVQRAILCGVPMTTTAHFAESKEPFGPQWYASAGYWGAWTKHAVHLAPWVRSMSGKTAELLGKPTLSWLMEPLTPKKN